MSVKRKDKKGRVLRDGEIQKADGRYEFRYTDIGGVRRSVYSWKLNETDKTPDGKREDLSLREKEEIIRKESADKLQTKGKRMSIKDLFNEALSTKANIKDSTKYRYIETFESYILPYIGGVIVRDAKYTTMTDLYTKLKDEVGISGATIRNVHSILNWMFDHAVLSDYVRRNVTLGADKAIKVERRKVKSMTLEEQMRFLECVDRSWASEMHKDFVRFLLWTGCRVSEAAGVRWEDCNLEEKTISISRIVSYNNVNSPDKKYRYCISSTKTFGSERIIPMTEDLRDMLMRLREYNIKSTMAYGNIVFCNSNGMPCTEMETTKYIKRLVARNNRDEINRCKASGGTPKLLPRLTPHSLRHTFCSRLCEVESNIKSVQEIMGHSNALTTLNIYAEANKTVKSDTIKKLDAYTTKRTTNDG